MRRLRRFLLAPAVLLATQRAAFLQNFLLPACLCCFPLCLSLKRGSDCGYLHQRVAVFVSERICSQDGRRFTSLCRPSAGVGGYAIPRILAARCGACTAQHSALCCARGAGGGAVWWLLLRHGVATTGLFHSSCPAASSLAAGSLYLPFVILVCYPLSVDATCCLAFSLKRGHGGWCAWRGLLYSPPYLPYLLKTGGQGAASTRFVSATTRHSWRFLPPYIPAELRAALRCHSGGPTIACHHTTLSALLPPLLPVFSPTSPATYLPDAFS